MRKTFPATVEHLHAILDWIRERVMGFDARTMMQIELACEEAIVNVIRHSYSSEIEVEVTVKGGVTIVFKDWGKAFNPLERKEVDIEAPIEEREIGGLGIHLMRRCMDEVHYRREGDANVLVLEKRY